MLKNKFIMGPGMKGTGPLIIQYHLSFAMQPFRRILQLCIAHPFDQLRSCNSRYYSGHWIKRLAFVKGVAVATGSAVAIFKGHLIGYSKI